MEPSDLLRFVVGVLERLGIRYFVTGSTVTIFYGEPRFTNDIDIVVDLPASGVSEFCRQFPDDDFYVSTEVARTPFGGTPCSTSSNPARASRWT